MGPRQWSREATPASCSHSITARQGTHRQMHVRRTHHRTPHGTIQHGTVRSVLVRPHAARHGGGTQTLGDAAGVLVVPETVDGRRVTQREMNQAVAALRLLPGVDLALVASKGIQIHLYPSSGLEGGLLGATTIVQDNGSGPWKPTMIRVAVRSGLTGNEAIGEIVQHEFGHAVSVLREQDRTEDAAIAYAKRW